MKTGIAFGALVLVGLTRHLATVVLAENYNLAIREHASHLTSSFKIIKP